jgi:hypothetical protein
LVDLNVLDDKVAGIKTLGICVCLCVLQETQEELSRLDWPSCAGDTELLSCKRIPSTLLNNFKSLIKRTLRSTSSSASISSHGNGLLVFLDILEELDGALKLPAVDSLGSLAGVLEGNAKVRASGLRRFTGIYLSCCVSNL